MMNPVIRGIPVLTFAGGFVGGLYWTILPDITNVSFGAPAEKKKILYFEEDKDLDSHNLKLSKEVEAKLLEKGASEAYLKDVDYFWSKKPDVVCIGSTGNIMTSFIGLPVNFLYQNVDQIHLKTDTKDGQLRRAMFLSDSAKMFAMASAHYRLDSMEFVGKLTLIATAMGPVVTSHYLQPFITTKSNVRQFSIVIAIVAAWALLFYQLSKILKAKMIYSSDRKAAELGSEFFNGGIEYFTKTLDRNKTIHGLGVGDGSAVVDSDGNQVYGRFEIPEPQFTSRQSKLQQISDQQKEEK